MPAPSAALPRGSRYRSQADDRLKCGLPEGGNVADHAPTRRCGDRLHAIVREVWRELPRYGQRHLLYLIHSERDAGWGDLPRVVPLRAEQAACRSRSCQGTRSVVFSTSTGSGALFGPASVQAFLRPGMAVLDIGANIGYFTLVASPRVGVSGLVESFDLHDEIRRRLVRNVEQNGLANVTVRSEALARASGETRFYSSADAANQGISSTIAGSSPPRGRSARSARRSSPKRSVSTMRRRGWSVRST